MLRPLLVLQHVRAAVPAGSRKRVLQAIAETLADDGSSADELFDELMNRERLGSTGLGEGVAIPHCRQDCDTIRVCLMTTQQAVDYEASDGAPVDIFFTLIVPTQENEAHLLALAQLSTVFADEQNRTALRACSQDDVLQHTMLEMLNNAAGNDARRA